MWPAYSVASLLPHSHRELRLSFDGLSINARVRNSLRLPRGDAPRTIYVISGPQWTARLPREQRELLARLAGVLAQSRGRELQNKTATFKSDMGEVPNRDRSIKVYYTPWDQGPVPVVQLGAANGIPVCATPVKGDTLYRENLETSPLMINMRKDARNSKFAFIGVGAISNGAVCAKSFAAIEDQKLRAELRKAIGEYSLVGEINNRLFDRSGRDCTARIKGFNSYFMNVLNLDELRNLVKKGSNVVLVATGLAKTEAIRVALQNGLANVVITDRQVAQRLIV